MRVTWVSLASGALCVSLVAGIPDAVLATAQAADAAKAVETPSPAVSVPLVGAKDVLGADDRAAEAFLSTKRPAPVFPAAGTAMVEVPAAGTAPADAVGLPVTVGFPDPELIKKLGVEDLLTADAAATQGEPVSRTDPFTPPASVSSTTTSTTADPLPVQTTVSGKPLPGDTPPVVPDPPTGPPDINATAPAGAVTPSAPTAVQVEVLDRKTSEGLGVSGFAFLARRADKGATSGPVTVTLDASGFADAYGAGYLDRLQVLRFPECALAPDALVSVPECGATSVIPSVVDRKARTVTLVLPAAADPSVPAAPLTPAPDPVDPGPTAPTAPATPLAPAALDSTTIEPAAATTVDMAAVVSGSSGVFALTAGVSSSTGSFAATSLNAAGSWSAGGNSGSMSYDYPLVLPPATGGATPRVALSYSSGSVDGMTPANNTQASWAGLGWDFVPGFIERKYLSCSLDGHPGYSDLCWKTWNATLSLGGASYPLIPDASDSTHTNWFVRDNPGYEVHRAVSGLADPNQSTTKEFWVVTTPDGTQYTFGRGYGQSTTDPTNSTFTVPTFSDDPGEPSYSSSGWTAGQVSAQPWRWNLDRVVDPNGNVTRYYYLKESNRYSKLGNSSWPIVYTSGGLLDRIEYGSQSGSEASFGQEVDFNRQYRCTALDASCTAPTKNATGYPDVPTDLICPISTVCSESSPSFFDTKRISSVTTRAIKDAVWRNLDTYTFTHSWLSPADSIPQLWLNKIQRTGFDGAASKNQRPVLFNGVALANRADSGGSVLPASFYRISMVTDEVGAETSFTYNQPDPCATFSGWNDNAQDCYPVYWTPDGLPSGWGAFNKWILSAVSVHDSTTGSPDIVTTYTYSNGGAWHHNDDPVIDGTPLTTWDQWRGYSTVKATTGSGAGRTSVKTRYYRGMDGDKLTSTTTKSVSVVDADGTTTTVDKDILAGKVRETQSFDTANAEIDGSVTSYTLYNVKFGGTEWPDSAMVRPTDSMSRERYYDSAGAQTRFRHTSTVFDSTYGVPTKVTDFGDTASSTDTTCTTIDYVQNAAAWIIDKQVETTTVDGACGAGTVVGHTKTYYDGAASNLTAPTVGNVTKSLSYINGTDTTSTVMAYDTYGRVVRTNQTLDATATGTPPTGPVATDGWATTRIAYTPASGPGSPTQIDTTNDLGQVSSVSPDGTRGLPLSERKATGTTTPTTSYQTSYAYDPLGRLTEVYLKSSTKPSYKFAYFDWNTAGEIAHVITSVLTDDTGAGTYIDSADYYDGLGRIREHQVESPAQYTVTKRIISATRYDNEGRVAATTAGINSSVAVGGSMYNPDPATTPSETRYVYDEQGQTVSTNLYSSGSFEFATSTATYYGDHTSVVTPKNAATDYGKVTTYTDVFGNPTSVQEVLPGSVVHTVDYGYDALHRLTSVATKAAAGAPTTTASTSYDRLGRVTGSSDPDAGSTANTYDFGGRLLVSATAGLRTVTTSYDSLGRPKTRTSAVAGAGSSSNTWTYDAAFPGSLDAQSTVAYAKTGAAGNPVVASGLLATPADRTYTVAYSNYDSLQRPQTTTYTLPINEGALGRSYVFGTSWDKAGRVSSVASPAVGPLPAETISYAYDANGYPTTVTGTYTATTAYTTPYVQNLSYTPTGQLQTASLGSATGATNLDTTVAVNYGYATDTLWLNHTDVKIGAAGNGLYLANQDITYDYAGLPTEITDSAPGVGQTECYRYDTQQRLTAYYTQSAALCATSGTDASVVNNANVTSTAGPDGYAALYTVDYLGQLTGLTERRPATKTATQATAIVSSLTRGGSQPHAVTAVARTIDGLAAPGQTYVYDGTGRQTTRTLPANSRTLGDIAHGGTSNLTYDGNGRWLSSTDSDPAVPATGVRTTGYIYDANGTLLARHDDDAGDDLAATGARPGGQRTLWLGTGGSAGIGATGMAGTGGLQIQTTRKPGATPTTAGTASAVDPAQQLLTVSRAIVAPVLANGAPLQVATHTASALLSASTASGVVTQAATPATGRIWFTVGDAHASLGGAGTPGITVAGNGANTDAASPQSQMVTVAGASIAAWPSGASGASATVAGTVGIRRTTPYGADRTAPATAAPLTGTIGATGTANTKTNTAGGIGALGFLNASETTNGAEDGPVLPGAATLAGSGYATTGLVQLGARGYDPALGVFTAPDPLSNPLNPSDAGSYTYANSRVGISTDPTGLRPLECTGSCNTNYHKSVNKGREQRKESEDASGGAQAARHFKLPVEDQVQNVEPQEGLSAWQWAGIILVAVVVVVVVVVACNAFCAALGAAAFEGLVAAQTTAVGGAAISAATLGSKVAVDSFGGQASVAGAGAAALRTTAAQGAADDWPIISGIVRDATKGKGNYGLGSGTASQAERAGQAWVGEGHRVASDAKTLISLDGLRQFRPPSFKPSLDSWQANFERRWTPGGQWQGNGHLDVTDVS